VSACDLCEAAVLTRRYYDDEHCWIADCEICQVPMVVWRHHDAAPPPTVRTRLHEALATVARARYVDTPWRIDDVMRNIPEHYHAHARPARAARF
jgi:hypothetical protein